MKFFLAGIIQGSEKGKGVHSQDYRKRIRELIEKHTADADIYDPVANYPGSVDYPDDYASEVFFGLMKSAAETDVLIAFLPEASLGTAIEIWQAHNAGVFTIVVSPMVHNWVVKFLPDVLLEDMDAFEEFLAEGGLETALSKKS